MRDYWQHIRALYALIFVICAVISFSAAFPFQPYRYLSLEPQQEEVCTDALVRVDAEREIVDPLLGTVTSAVVKSWWKDVDTGQLTEYAGEVPIELEANGYEVLTSPVVRTSPLEPQEAYLYSETTAYGSIGIFPRHTTIAVTSENPVTAVDCED